MTKNEYQEYLKKCASRFYSDKYYTKEQYDADLDAVEVEDFDLSKFKLPEETKRRINRLFDEEDTDRNGNLILRGFTYHDSVEIKILHLHYGDYGRDLSYWAYNDEDLLLYTYCEGDTTLTLFDNVETYKRDKQEMLDWYKKEIL